MLAKMIPRACILLVLSLSAAPGWAGLHPRIFVRHDAATVGKGPTVSQLRARLNNPAYARWRAPLSRQGSAATLERAARYLETGAPAELLAVRDFLTSHTFSYARQDVGGFLAGAEMATAFDWTYDGLSVADRNSAMDHIVATCDSSLEFLLHGQPDINHNYTYMALNTVAVCGLALQGESLPYGGKSAGYLALARDFLEKPGMVLDTWSAREGAWGEGSHYTFHETVRNLVMMLAAFRSATDRDYFAEARIRYNDFPAKVGRFLIYSTRPDLTFERTGDTSANRVQAALTVPVTVEALAAGLGDSADAARLRSFADDLLTAYRDKAVEPSLGWGMRIFFDPRATRTPSYRTLPLAARLGAGTYEQVVFRNGWAAGSTQITILAGDHFTDHQHFDKGQFLIYHGGGLAVDGGAYDGMYKPGAHPNEYASRTLAHNCMLVYDPEQQFPNGYTNDGGQNVIRGKQHHAGWPAFLAHRETEGLHTAEVLAYDAAEQYDYLRVDLTKAYSDKIRHYERQFVYLPATDFLLVFDRVAAALSDYQKRWLLHFQEPPEVDGAAADTGVRAYPDAQFVTERRQQGALFIRTLLPAPHKTTVIGGPGYEYFNLFTGVNYPPSNPAVAAESRESGKWRIEVSPELPAEEDRFLNVLQIAESGATPAVAKLVTGADGLAGAQFSDRVVIFTAGVLPARYEVSSTNPAGHLVVQLPPLTDVTVHINGVSLGTQKVNAQGVLSFQDRGTGARRVEVSPAGQ
jgi:Heparinase II/III-like protein